MVVPAAPSGEGLRPTRKTAGQGPGGSDAWKLAVGRRIRELRGSKSQEQLARLAGISDGTLAAIESGRSDPRLGTLLRLVTALELSCVEEVLGPLPTDRILSYSGDA